LEEINHESDLGRMSIHHCCQLAANALQIWKGDASVAAGNRGGEMSSWPMNIAAGKEAGRDLQSGEQQSGGTGAATLSPLSVWNMMQDGAAVERWHEEEKL
jgi:hypothetical protein